MENRVVYILVHGSGLGGWCWDRVKQIMESQGTIVYTPTIPETSRNLSEDIDYMVKFMENKAVRKCVLVGHSYGGMVVTGVTDRLKSHVEKVIFLDAAVPKNGDDFASHIPGISEDQAEQRRQAFRRLSKDGIWIDPIPPEMAGISDKQEIARVNEHSRPYALQTWIDPIELNNDGLRGVDKTYILATDPPTSIMGYPVHGAIAQKSQNWIYREIQCGHAAMLIQPEEVARLLLE